MQTPQRTNLAGLDRGAMQAFFTELGEQRFRAEQVIKWIYRHGVTDFQAMSDLGKALRLRLAGIATVSLPQAGAPRVAADGVHKWPLTLADGNVVETVFIPEHDRGTLCVSSQAGCILNCTFCATARQGFSRNLDAAEIIGQLLIAAASLRRQEAPRPITNVVMMGMGEPLLNFDNVVTAINLMLDDFSFGLSRRRVTLSTAGVAPAIERLAAECPVSLAVSLHAPDDELRDQLVPLNRKYPVAVLLDACRRYVEKEPRRRITFEYVMLQGVNDDPARARALAALLAGLPANVNLIPFNPSPGIDYRCSSVEAINRFRDVLMKAGIVTVTRKTRGSDIEAACGQLAGSIRDRTSRARRFARLPVAVH